ncbi:MAG: hypothetical protein ACRDRX_19545 [Pseudonocardiaceae bacterium]
MSYEERLHRPVRQDGMPPPHAAGRIEPPAVAHRARWLTPRLVSWTLTIILLGTGAGALGALVLPRTYGARAEVLYSISVADQGGDPLRQDRQLATQLVLLKNRAVLEPIAQKQQRLFEDLDKEVSASVVGNSNVIEVEVHAASEPAATQTLQAVVDGYLALAGQPSGVARNLSTQLTQARQNTTALQTRERQLVPEVLAGTTPQPTLNDTRTQLTTSLEWEKTLQARIDEIQLTGQTGSAAQVLTPPYVLPEPTIPRWLTSAGLGTLVGLIVAGVMLIIGALRATARDADPVNPL